MRSIPLLIVALCCVWGVSFAGEIPDTCTQKPPIGIDPNLYLWSKEHDEAWHRDHHVYRYKKMNFCSGLTAATREIIYIFPSWSYHKWREDWFYPIQLVNTAVGVLVTKGSELPHPVTLAGKIIIDDMREPVRFVQAYPEPSGKPQIVILQYVKPEDIPRHADSHVFRLLDLGSSPPYITPKPLPFSSGYLNQKELRISKEVSKKFDEDELPSPESFKIEKVAEGEYVLSAQAYDGYHQDGSFSKTIASRRFKYSRESRSVTLLEGK